MNYMGTFIDYTPVQSVDETADMTDMASQASLMNAGTARARSWRESPTKSLIALWVFLVLLYALLTYFFRRFVA